MKFSIGTKLRASGLIVLVFILLMIISNQIVVGVYQDTSSKLVVEYNELHAVEELKFSLNNLLVSASNFAVYKNKNDAVYFESLIHIANEKLDHSRSVLTQKHEVSILGNFGAMLIKVDSIANQMFAINGKTEQEKITVLLNSINAEINGSIAKVDKLLGETKTEITEYVAINKTSLKHSRITIFTLGISLTLIILIGGMLFIKNLTQPIEELVITTNKISKGDRTAKVNITSGDEFQALADSFNTMLDALEQSSVSKNYLNDILKNMFDALIVTDQELNIRSINQAAMLLLGYTEDEVKGKNISLIFEKEKEYVFESKNQKLNDYIPIINGQSYIRVKSDHLIPVIFSSAILKNEKDETDGLIIVGHDITEKMLVEEKLEKLRKERLIDINEAQEEEKIRIATDLHDGLGQMLTAISYALQNLNLNEKNEENEFQDNIHAIQTQIDSAIHEAKNLAHNLIPIVLKDFGLIVAIKNLMVKANYLHKTRFKFDAFDFDDRINPKMEKAFYRICQESMHNIVKHSNAKNATYQLFKQGENIVLVIEDDGDGFDVNNINNKKPSGIGLISINERVLAFGGNFTINSQIGHGTELIIEMPCLKN